MSRAAMNRSRRPLPRIRRIQLPRINFQRVTNKPMPTFVTHVESGFESMGYVSGPGAVSRANVEKCWHIGAGGAGGTSFAGFAAPSLPRGLTHNNAMSTDAILGPGGTIAGRMPNFERRPQQEE